MNGNFAPKKSFPDFASSVDDYVDDDGDYGILI